MRIAIIAALAGELKPLVDGWEKRPTGAAGVLLWRRPARHSDEVIAVCAGMGADAARRAFAEAEREGAVDAVISAGWAGACDASAEAGNCLLLSEVIDAQTGERFSLTDEAPKLSLVTTPWVADAAEKRRLAATYDAVAVDMEAATIARLARMRAIPMLCVKAVSDGMDAMLPDMNPFIDRMGQMRLAAFVMHVLLRPRFWPQLIRLGRYSAAGAKEMARVLEVILAAKDWERVNRTGEISA